ncbi:hypothetical protein M408DRAFT_330504 [Serendipita vermifera MAFF 305830]|uniref:NADPH-dependent diflavin oxidoreductase 1 n=1 Tax=Serendipita vermifera MAFF 305830 TaxID=933852 RepID=A0A0C2WJN1_SERVB|nr:hypothetical protein M408DRAFT_330504 [Serendipita vermifera MAFF 305830]
MEFTVFGLGDSAYERFCWASKMLVRRLLSLGAMEFHPSRHSDEQERFGYETALIPWMEEMFETLLTNYPLPDSLQVLPASQLPSPRITLITQEEGSIMPFLPDEPATIYHDAVLIKNQRVTKPDWYQDVRHLTFSFKENLTWAPGDIAVLHPCAQREDVDALLERFGWTSMADKPLRIQQTSSSQPLPAYLLDRPTTLRNLFTSVLDISSVPRKAFFELLVHFTEDELEIGKLQEFTSLSAEGQDDLYEYTHRVRRTILEVLQDFRHISIPLDYIFDVFPLIRPRQFSIASSSQYAKQKNVAPSSTDEPAKSSGTELDLCVAIVSYKTRLKVPRRGLCTTWLASLEPATGEDHTSATTLRIGIRKGALKVPEPGKDEKIAPVICVGPGTGVAPMRAVIQERIVRGEHDNVLYFGCRSAKEDYYYADEWETAAQAGKLTFSVAFSRDQEKKIYVQDLIEQDAFRIWDLVEKQRASVYISGASNKMPAAVKAAIKTAAISEGKLSEEEATKYISTMEWEGRLYEECWS